MTTLPTPNAALTEISEAVRSLCNGHPHAKIAWPHRELHEIADRLDRLAAPSPAARGTCPIDATPCGLTCDADERASCRAAAQDDPLAAEDACLSAHGEPAAQAECQHSWTEDSAGQPSNCHDCGATVTYPAAQDDPAKGLEALIREWARWYHLNELTISKGLKPSDSEIDFEVEAHKAMKAALTDHATATRQIAELKAERDAALRECSKWATEAGFAKGKLETSELAGVVDDWRDRALAAEADAARVREVLEWKLIETAPLDAERVDVWLAPLDDDGNELTPCRCPDAWYEAGGWWAYGVGAPGPVRILHRITHWREIDKTRPAALTQRGA